MENLWKHSHESCHINMLRATIFAITQKNTTNELQITRRRAVLRTIKLLIFLNPSQPREIVPLRIYNNFCPVWQELSQAPTLFHCSACRQQLGPSLDKVRSTITRVFHCLLVIIHYCFIELLLGMGDYLLMKNLAKIVYFLSIIKSTGNYLLPKRILVVPSKATALKSI